MKRILLFSLLISLTVSSFAQTSISVPLATYRNRIAKQGGESGVPYANVPIVSNQHPSERIRGSATLIGTTTYDEQPSNQRLFPGPGGSLAATWTGSTQIALPSTASPWTDRGTFYNYFDGDNWFFNSPHLDSSRVEVLRSGYPSNVILKNGGEWMCSHIPEDTVLGTMSRANAGSGNWTVNGPTTLNVMWPHATAYGNTIHVIGADDNTLLGTNDKADVTNYLSYSRSQDGGNTWDILDVRLPMEDSTDCINYIGADNYAIDANKNTVAIVAGGLDNSVFLWKSTDGGSSWTRSTIIQFPTCGGYIDADTFSHPVNVTDGSYAVLVDNSGKVHVWYNDLYISNPVAGDNFITIYYPTANFGLEYWNDGMPTGGGQLIATDSDDVNTGLGSVFLYGAYSSSYTAMPTVSMDSTTGKMYCVYSEAVPFSNLDGTGGTPGTDTTAHSYRDLFGVYSTDGGTTWSKQANLTLTALLLNNPLENVYPAAAKSVATVQRPGQVDVTWMRDGTPGTFLIKPNLNSDAVNDIMFESFNMNDFNGFAGVKNVNGLTYQDLNVYPNPSNGLVTLNVAGLANEKAFITVTNILGETVKIYNNIQLTGNVQINGSNLADGLYVVKVQTNTHVLTGKITIAH